MMSRLKPCPFCGGEARPTSWLHSESETYVIQCDNCHLDMGEFDTEEEAAEAWNRRTEKFEEPKINIGWMPDACRYCPNHPSNGGSGICHCVLGTPTIY